MKLLHIVKDLNFLNVQGTIAKNVSEICYDSRQCMRDSLFVAIEGLQSDGHDYIPDAIIRGATCIVHEKNIPFEPNITYLKVSNSRRMLGKLGKEFFGNPSADLCLIGITGTNGKTTVSYFLESILLDAGFNTGVIGTINYRFNGLVTQSVNTTPESLDLQRILRQMVNAGITHVVMEVSSHAIDLKRTNDCEYNIGIFTNLSQEHLDYHHTIENYFDVKKTFFKELLKEGTIIVNGGDPWGSRLISEIKAPVITFGIDNEYDISVNNFTLSTDGIRAEIKVTDGLFPITSSIIGKFNLYNILASIAAAKALQIPEKYIQSGIEKVKNVPGRLERTNSPDEPATFVDYAHTEDALKKVLENLSEFKKKNIITVFGCGGDRDRTKRPHMGKAAIELSDLVVVTSDNPRTEDAFKIIEEIEKGIKPYSVKKYLPEEIKKYFHNKGYVIIPDRKFAIEFAISIADSEDIVLIAGKGHEDYQIIGNMRIPFNDRIVSREALNNRSLRTVH